MKKTYNNPLCTILPQRVVMGIMGFLAIAVSYTIRQSLSVTITEMVPKKTDARIGETYSWSETEQGWVLSSFYIGYVISHVPGGLVAEKFGAKWTIGCGVLLMGVLNALTPIAVRYGNIMVVIVLRIIMGLGGGTTYPALSVMLAAWVPEKERGKLGSIVFGGGQIGSLVSFALSSVILGKYHWQYNFYCWSIISVIWFILFTITCYSDPASHPFITQKELNYLNAELGQTKRNDKLPPTPWSSILTNIPVMAMVFAQMGHDWILYVISSDLPKYLKEVLHVPTEEVGFYTSLPFLGMWLFSIFSGYVSDFLIVRRILTITQARKFFTFLGAVPPAFFIMAASYAEKNLFVVVTMFVCAMSFLGNFYPGLKINSLDLSPNYSGSLMALTNGIGGISGVVVPPFIGYIVDDKTNSAILQWRKVFWITFGFSIVRTVVFLLWGSGVVQQFNNPVKQLSVESGISRQPDTPTNRYEMSSDLSDQTIDKNVVVFNEQNKT
ncbi:putative inorganic phosphate cotransporter [Contarinia nasturtii]|uniref:putative inorganic phosphate cotransporter n=1 Tax=Contarinia nasturtii TaxID=265458 RepID=UPI0012D49684|nr:putative inorganic phosphate cotransporter [Contarinia nasturtii]